MTSNPFNVIKYAIALSVVSSLTLAAMADSLPAATPIQSNSVKVSQLLDAYAKVQNIWDDCYRIKSGCSDLLSEGLNAPSRKSWVDYYVSKAGQNLDGLQSQFNDTSFPADLSADMAPVWLKVGQALSDMRKQFQSLQSEAACVKAPTDGKYPAVFWSSSRALLQSANKFDEALIASLEILDKSRDNALLSLGQAGAGAASESGASEANEVRNGQTSDIGLTVSDSTILKGSADKIAADRGF